jgi:hypothetical protein
MVAGPVPLAAEVICSQVTLLVADQEQPERPVSMKLPPPPDVVAFAEVGSMAKLHGGPPWVIVMLCDPTVIVPDRIGESEFGATVKPAVPFPVPVWPRSIVIQSTVEATGREQVLALATIVKVPFPPPCGNDCGVEVIVNVQAVVWAPRPPARAKRM